MAKKAAPKVTHAKTTATPKATPKAAGTATATRPRPASKTAVYSALAQQTGLDRKQIARLFDALNQLIAKELGKKGPGQVVVPGLVKLKVVRKPATKARPGRNPHTGAPITIQARPARNVVRAVPMKALKEMV